MSAWRARTAEGEAATEVVLETFHVNGLLLAAGSRLAARERLTAARGLWCLPGGRSPCPRSRGGWA